MFMTDSIYCDLESITQYNFSIFDKVIVIYSKLPELKPLINFNFDLY